MLFAFKIFSLSRYPNFLASTRPVPSRSKNLFPSGPGCNMVKIKCFSNGLVRSPTEPSRKVKSPPPYARIPFEQYRLSDFYYYAAEIHKLDKEYCSTRISACRTFGTRMREGSIHHDHFTQVSRLGIRCPFSASCWPSSYSSISGWQRKTQTQNIVDFVL